MAARFAAAGSAPARWARPSAARPAPRTYVSFWCAKGHETRPSFAHDAAIPESWDCPRCGWPAGRTDKDAPPAPPRTEPYKTHLAYVRERRSDKDGEEILKEALDKLRGNPWKP